MRSWRKYQLGMATNESRPITAAGLRISIYNGFIAAFAAPQRVKARRAKHEASCFAREQSALPTSAYASSFAEWPVLSRQ